jgi:hypothetical protein
MQNKRKLSQLLLEYSRDSFQLANNPSCFMEINTREEHQIIIEEPSRFRLVCVVEYDQYPAFEKNIMNLIFSYLTWAQRSLFFERSPKSKKWVTMEFVQNNVGIYHYGDLCPLWDRHVHSWEVNAEEEYYVCEALDAEIDLIKNLDKRSLFKNFRDARNGRLGMMLDARTNPAKRSKALWGYLIRGFFERRDVFSLAKIVEQHGTELIHKEVLRDVRFWWIQRDSLDPLGLDCLALIIPFVSDTRRTEACDAFLQIIDNETISKRIQHIFYVRKP